MCSEGGQEGGDCGWTLDVLGLLGGEGREHTWLGDPREWAEVERAGCWMRLLSGISQVQMPMGLGLRTFILGGRGRDDTQKSF